MTTSDNQERITPEGTVGTMLPSNFKGIVIPDLSHLPCGYLQPSTTYKPFRYPWAHERWLLHERLHWLPEEVPLRDDVGDYNNRMEAPYVALTTHILKFFTQQDQEVCCGYSLYARFIQNSEVLDLMTGIRNREVVHKLAYSHFTDTIGLPETTYSAFLHYEEMRRQHDYLHTFNPTDVYGLLLSIGVFSAFAEGICLFGSFVLLLNFQRKGLLKGLGQIVSWSIRDEDLHVLCMTQVFREMVEDLKDHIDTDRLHKDIVRICREMVEHEHAFITQCYAIGDTPDLTQKEVEDYICYLADHRLGQLGYPPIFNIQNPLPWVNEHVYAQEHTNFFENRATEYARAATTGDWGDAYD